MIDVCSEFQIHLRHSHTYMFGTGCSFSKFKSHVEINTLTYRFMHWHVEPIDCLDICHENKTITISKLNTVNRLTTTLPKMKPFNPSIGTKTPKSQLNFWKSNRWNSVFRFFWFIWSTIVYKIWLFDENNWKNFDWNVVWVNYIITPSIMFYRVKSIRRKLSVRLGWDRTNLFQVFQIFFSQ